MGRYVCYYVQYFVWGKKYHKMESEVRTKSSTLLCIHPKLCLYVVNILQQPKLPPVQADLPVLPPHGGQHEVDQVEDEDTNTLDKTAIEKRENDRLSECDPEPCIRNVKI